MWVFKPRPLVSKNRIPERSVLVQNASVAEARHNVQLLANCEPARRTGVETRERFTLESSLGRKYVSKTDERQDGQVKSPCTGEEPSQKTQTTQRAETSRTWVVALTFVIFGGSPKKCSHHRKRAL